MNVFNPGSPRFRRGVVVLSTVACTFAGAHVVMADFGSQRHIFTEVQAWVIPKVDALFGVTQSEIDAFKEPVAEKQEPWLQLKKGDETDNDKKMFRDAGSIFDQSKER
jgi:hypothetical protein